MSQGQKPADGLRCCVGIIPSSIASSFQSNPVTSAMTRHRQKRRKAMQRKKRILTGDRPTGQLHLGHHVGTLKNRFRLQDEYECFFIIADLQVLTDHLEDHASIESNVFEVMCDYLGVGLRPENTFFVQSQV
ncbi:MAG: tryptophanyl-tRNA synthetase, partial [Candidatus Berkelbacteria bacterium Licking1014_85]